MKKFYEKYADGMYGRKEQNLQTQTEETDTFLTHILRGKERKGERHKSKRFLKKHS